MLTLLLLLAVQTPDTAAAAATMTPAVRALLDRRGSMSAEAFAQQLEALAASDTVAAELMGEALLSGEFGMRVDKPAACGWFERGAGKRGDATHNLALCHERGEGRPKDLARSRALYAQAAELGWVQAKCALGNLLVNGQGGPVDADRGVRLCREAAEAGNPNAQADYGIFLLEGKLVPKDVVEARRWLTAAAEQKQANAAFLVAQIHWFGDGTPFDAGQAEQWWRVAYASGRADAAIHVAQAIHRRMAPDGKSIADRTLIPEWMRWLRIAAAEDPDPAQRAKWAHLVKALEESD